MKFVFAKNYNELSKKAAGLIINEIKKNPKLLVCVATGASPTGTYRLLADYRKKHNEFFKNVRIIKLDEWGGLEMDDPATCEDYIRKNIIKPLGISKDRYFSFDSNPQEPKLECRKISAILKKEGPIDLCILGLGIDGHLGLNEPAEKLKPHAHANKLRSVTMQHKMLAKSEGKPKYGLTLGMQDILSSGKILLLVAGEDKEAIFRKTVKGRITNRVPASLLRKQKNAICISDLKF